MLEQLVEDGGNIGEALARSRSGGEDVGLTFASSFKSSFLMFVEPFNSLKIGSAFLT